MDKQDRGKRNYEKNDVRKNDVRKDMACTSPCGHPQLRCRFFILTHTLVHEVTSPQAFEGLRLNNRKVRRPELTFATMDHNVPTTDRSLPIADLIAAKQMETLAQNCAEF